MTIKTKSRRIENVIISAAERVRNSGNGNPTWRLLTSHGIYLTAIDASVGYSIDNMTNSRLPEYVIGNPAEPRVTLIVSNTNRVAYIERDGRVIT